MTEVGRITAIIDGDISKLTSALSLARSQATNAVAGIETGMKGGLKNGIAGINWNGLGMDTAGDYLRGITAGMGPIGTALEGVATALGPTGIVAVAAIAGSAVIIKAAWEASSAWEMGMSQISKTTGIGKGTTEFSQLNEDLKELYSTMPTTATEIQNVAQAAGSLGIETDSIAGFTGVALEMGSAFDIPAEQAAVSIGKVESQLKKLPDGVEDSAQFARHWGSAVDHAGNSMNATEAEVLDFSTRAAGSLSMLGGSAYELAGWGGATVSVFSSSQLAAGSFNAALTQLTGTTKGSQEAQAKAAEMLGVTTDEFARMMSTDPTDTVLRLGNALEELDPAEATKAAGILGGGYGDDFFKKMVGHTDEWRGKIDEVVAAGEKGESIGKSFEAGSEGAKAAMQELKNSISTILIDIGGPILAAFTPLLSGLAEGLNKIREIGENLWGPLTTVLSPLTTGAGILAGHIGTMAGMSLDVLVLASQAISKAFELGGKYAEAVKAEILEIIENSETFKTVSGYVGDLKDSFQTLYDKIKEVFDKIVDGLSNAIPTAIKGTGDALGTLAEKAGLGGVSDAAGGVFDFFGDVNARVWGEEIGKEAADGIKGSGLAKAPGEALNSDEAKREAEKAAQDLAKSYSKELYDTVQGFGGISDLDALAILNEQSSSPKKKDSSIGAVNVGGVQIDSTLDAANRNAWVVLKTEGGQEIDRRNIRGGEWNGDTPGAIRDMMLAHPETFGNLSELEQAELTGESDLVENLKIKAASVEVETTTEARLKELSSIDLQTMKANIAEIESEISGLSRGLRDIDEAFANISIEPVVMTVELNTNAAYTQWGHLVQDMENLTIRLPVELDIKVYTPEIRAIVDAAIVESLA